MKVGSRNSYIMRPASMAAAAMAATLRESLPALWLVFKITFPVVLALRVIGEFYPVVELAGELLYPVMATVGLPGETALPWAGAILLQPYAAYALLAERWEQTSLTVAEATIFGILVLEVHSIIVEVRIAQMLGVRAWFTCALRFGTALALGALLHWTYTKFGWLQEPAQIPLIDTSLADDSWAGWAKGQLNTWIAIAVIIYALNLLMRAMRHFHIERFFIWLLAPVMRLVGIHKSASTVGVIGLVLGLTFGAALLVAEKRSGRVSRQDIFLSVSLLGICHSVIEDTFLTALFGAHMSGVLFARTAFSLAIIAVVSRAVMALPTATRERWLMTPDDGKIDRQAKQPE